MPEMGAATIVFVLALIAFAIGLILDLVKRPGVLTAFAVGLALMAVGHMVR